MNVMPTLLAHELIDFERLIPFAVFGLIAVGVWWLLDFVAAARPRTAQRLDEYKNPNARRRDPTTVTKKQDAMTKMLEAASPALAAPLQPKSELEVSKLKLKLANAGFRGEGASTIFLGFKFLGLMVGLCLGGGAIAVTGDASQKRAVTAVLFAGGLFYLPQLVLMFLISRRKEAIFLSLPDALDLMVVCVEAGLGLDQAMRRVADEMRKIYPVIAQEFALCNFQLQVGRARVDVLHELGLRTGVDDLRSLSAILIQADKFGSSIAQALRVQSDSMRTRRRQLAEEKAAKTAVKLIFPLVIFIFPGIFVVLIGPAAITMVREMFPVMQNTGS
ncbi:MAG TPA: type II secretion system F family protein [Pirellulales bacterium]